MSTAQMEVWLCADVKDYQWSMEQVIRMAHMLRYVIEMNGAYPRRLGGE